MKVIAFGASTSRSSINKTLAQYTAKLIPQAEVVVLDLNNYILPLFSEDLEKEIGQPQAAKDFLQDIASADVLVISYAEHNGHYPAAYKNLFDWATRIERHVFANKPALYLATSPGAGGAKTVLEAAVNSAPHFGAQVKGSLSVASFYDKFDVENNLIVDEALAVELKQLTQTLLS